MSVTRNLEKRRTVGDLTVSQLSLSELRQELDRRIRNLQTERDQVLDRLALIDQELTGLGITMSQSESNGRPPHTGGRRPRNERPLAEVLITVLRDQGPLTTGEAAKAALEAGYATTSRTFATAVSATFARDDRFQKEDGRWTCPGPEDD